MTLERLNPLVAIDRASGLLVGNNLHAVGYLFTHRGDDSPSTPGTYTLGHNLVGAYSPTRYLGELPEDLVRGHNEALTALEANAIMEGLPPRVSAYWSTGEPRYWHSPRCICGKCGGYPVWVREGFIAFSNGARVTANITLWNGYVVGRILSLGVKTTTLGGASRQWLRVAIGGAVYGGYATSTRDLVNLKKLKGVA